MPDNYTSLGAILWRAWLFLSGLWATVISLFYVGDINYRGWRSLIDWEWSELLGFALLPFVGFILAPFLRWVFTGSFFARKK